VQYVAFDIGTNGLPSFNELKWYPPDFIMRDEYESKVAAIRLLVKSVRVIYYLSFRLYFLKVGLLLRQQLIRLEKIMIIVY